MRCLTCACTTERAHANDPATPTFRRWLAAPTPLPGGTEPKLKFYCELSRPSLAEARAELSAIVNAVLDEMLQPELHGLARPNLKT